MNAELQELLDNLDIEGYLDYEGIDYRHRMGSSGPQLNVKCCPSCGGSDWKVYLSAETGLGNCFHGSCEARTFNKWSFAKAHLGGACSNGDVIQHLKVVSAALGWRPKRRAKATTTVRGALVLPASIPLPDANGDVHGYLLKRGFGASVCEYFQLRYCHAGCFAWDEGGQRKYQDYSGRIIIPVFDMNGELASFQGRDTTGEKEPKYLFPTGYASTGSLLYNGHNAWGVKHLVIGEGAFDVMAIKEALDVEFDLRSVVPIGTFGMHLAHDQMSRLIELHKAGLETVTIMWDGEKPAIKAALDTAQAIARHGIEARVALLPKDKDPNEVAGATVREAYRTANDPRHPLGLKRILSRIFL